MGGTGADLGSQIIAYFLHVFGTGLSLSCDGGFRCGGATVYLVQEAPSASGRPRRMQFAKRNTGKGLPSIMGCQELNFR